MARLIFSFLGLLLSADAYGKNLTFCYQSRALHPHYMGDGRETPTNRPGAAIELIKFLDNNLEEINIILRREPWKRCLNDLEHGKVDALIARYSCNREGFAKYPKTSFDKIDTTKAFSNTATCFIHRKNVLLEWDGADLNVELPQGISVPSGYSLAEDLKNAGFQIYETRSVKQAQALLFNGRVGISLSDCNFKNLPENFTENTIPLSENYGYLVFSHQFYNDNLKLSEKIWKTLMEIDHKQFYSKY